MMHVTSDIVGLASKPEPITIRNRKFTIVKAPKPLVKGSRKIAMRLSFQ